MKRNGLSIDLGTVVVLLILVNVPIWAVAFFTVDQVQSSMQEKVAADFRAIARKNAVTINYAINHLVAEVGTIAISPVVREIVRRQNASYSGSPEVIHKRIREIDKTWLTPQANKLVEPLLSNPASKYLRQFVSVNPGFKRITVTDRLGAVAAANLKSVDYDQADEVWWRTAFKDGLIGSVLIEDVSFDPITLTNSIRITVPIQEDGQDLVLGIVLAVTDISDLFPLATGVKIGSSGETLLIKGDGTVVAGRELTSSQQVKLSYFDDIANAMHSTTRPDFLVATSLGGIKKAVAYLDTGLSASFPNLKWIAVVEQDYSEANAVTDNLIRKLLGAALGVLILITGLALYVSTHRRLQFTDIREVESED